MKISHLSSLQRVLKISFSWNVVANVLDHFTRNDVSKLLVLEDSPFFIREFPKLYESDYCCTNLKMCGV